MTDRAVTVLLVSTLLVGCAGDDSGPTPTMVEDSPVETSVDPNDPTVVRGQFEELIAGEIAAAVATLDEYSVIQPFDPVACDEQWNRSRSISGDEQLRASMQEITQQLCNNWEITYFLGDGYRYDIQQTDSIISPYVAEVTVDWYQHIEIVRENGEPVGQDFTLPRQWRLSYAHQDGQWEVVGVDEYSAEQPFWQSSDIGESIFIHKVAPTR